RRSLGGRHHVRGRELEFFDAHRVSPVTVRLQTGRLRSYQKERPWSCTPGSLPFCTQQSTSTGNFRGSNGSNVATSARTQHSDLVLCSLTSSNCHRTIKQGD